jgi:predicted nuclease of restriction endonuclease-like (RecB) superfamily
MRQFYQTYPNVHTARPITSQSGAEKSVIGQSLIGQSASPESSLAVISQSVIGQFSVHPPEKLSLAIEHLGNIARSFPLPWTHYVRLLRVKNPLACEFYSREALAGGWSVRQLHRQINSQFYERTALSKDKAAMLLKGEKPRSEDAVSAEEEIRNPLLLEFLGLKDEYSESELEDALIRHLETFLLELGNEYAFVGRQRRLRIGHEWFRVDLVFFHRRLRCLMIIDLLWGRPHNRSSVADFIMWPCQRKSRDFGGTKVWRHNIRRDYRLRRNSIKSLSSRHFNRDVVRLTSQRANALAFMSKSTSA